MIIVASVALVMLVALGIAASLSPSQDQQAAQTAESTENPTTQVPMSEYEGQYMTVEYPSSLQINIDEAMNDPDGWFLHFAEDPDFVKYDIAVQAGDEQPAYDNGSIGLEAFLSEQDYVPNNVVTEGAVVAGVDSLKTTGEFTAANGEEYYGLYASAEVNGKYVIITAAYPKSNEDITNSIDTLIASVRLK